MGIKIEKTDKALSSVGGLVIFKNLFDRLRAQVDFEAAIPSLKRNSSNNFNKFQNLIMAFIAGADCLDDVDRLSKDESFIEVNDGDVFTARSQGDLLRSFSPYNCKELNYSLIEMGYRMRSALLDKQERMVVDFDSTSHEQHGKKMEGLAFNYDGVWCLDSIEAFDENGIQFWHDVRPGSTYTSNGVTEIIHEIYGRMPKTKKFQKTKRYARADSGFSHADFFNACATKNVKFVVAMKQNVYGPLIDRVRHWQAQNPNKENRINFYDKRECEIGETLYKPDRCKPILRVIVMRALKEKSQGVLFKQKDDYDYYAFATTIGAHEMTNEEVIKFYRKRGNAENFIKELKNGLDLHHYPCQQLIANKAYGLIAAVAYNLMRFVALLDNRNKPIYAKNIRFRFVHLPVQVLRHARQVIFRFCEHHYREVQYWLQKITLTQFGLYDGNESGVAH